MYNTKFKKNPTHLKLLYLESCLVIRCYLVLKQEKLILIAKQRLSK